MMRDPQDYTGLIVKMAKQFYPSFYKKKEFKDLIQDGMEVFVKVCHQEEAKPFNCPFHTALGIQLKQTWLNELQGETCQKRGNRPQMISIDVEEDGEYRPLNDPALVNNPINKLDKYLDLSEEIKMVVQILRDSPSELIELSKTFSVIESLIRYLKKTKHLNREQIHQVRSQLSQLG
jgi:hypothetical protein